MALVSGSRLCSSGFVPSGSEWMDKQQLAKLYDGHKVGLRWWEEGDAETDENTGVRNENRSRRFGIDLGTSNGSDN
ncbi:hypothetical protein F4782DRAFT_199470 [Xylaria castorea]|nr:hypothetical protein F4782DRAFT_199470 [Xylaria castorea]